MTTPRVTVPVEPYMGSPEVLAGMTQAIVKADAEFGHELSAYRYRTLAQAAFDTVFVGLSAAPAPEGGVVDGDALKIATDLHTAFEKLIYGLPKYLEAENLTDEENMIREAWITLDVTVHRLAALATREEAPAEAGELVADLTVLSTCDDMEVSHSGGDTNVGDVARRCLNRLRAKPPAREDGGDRPIEASWTDGVTHAYVNLSAALSAERQAWRQKLGLRIASVRYLDVEVPPAREDAQPVAKVVRLGFSKGGISFTSAGNEADLPDGTPLFTHPAPDALRVAVALLERWYATRSEMSGAGTVETETRQFIATLQAEQKGGA